MKTLDHLISWSPQAIWSIYEDSAFAAMTFNLGPRTAMFPHRDWANLCWGWCTVSALGNFNANQGVHLVLWDLKLVIRFPSGSTIIIPSAMVRHSKASVGMNKMCYSVTQYSTGCLFWWVENGFVTDTKLLKDASKDMKEESLEKKKTCWWKGLAMLSKFFETPWTHSVTQEYDHYPISDRMLSWHSTIPINKEKTGQPTKDDTQPE